MPLAKNTIRFLVALDESSNPEKGFGYMTPFEESICFKISIEFDINNVNSSLPIIM